MKIPFWATALTICGILVLCTLGFWQLQRLEWKTAVLAALDREAAADPMSFELTGRSLTALPPGTLVKRGFAEGIYLHDKAILLGPRTHDGAPGYHVITPFETLDNTVLLVNRGWVPLDIAADGYSRPDEPMIIAGALRPIEPPSRFVPENDPAQENWHRLDPASIAAAKDLEDLLPGFVFYAQATDTPSGTYPLALEIGALYPRNNHLPYALFWFSMAGILAVIYGLRFYEPEKS
ncbi:MAG: SURF1 family protein [Rhodospirillales bacterium]|nr:SURF1 family protein [Rhodospirillales bacterium]MCB9996182.1 SURF1 family protein [Rhodospirillales bacterium]